MNPIIKALGHILSCKEATRVVSQMQDRPLTGFERWKLAMHLRVCDACTSFERQVRFLREALRRYRA